MHPVTGVRSSRRDRDSSITPQVRFSSPSRSSRTSHGLLPTTGLLLQQANSFKLHNGGQINSPLTTPLPRIIPIIRSSRPKTSGNRGEGGRIIPSILPLPHQSTEAGYKKSSHHHNQPHDSTTKPLTAFSSTQQAPPPHKKKKTCPLW